MRPTPGTTRHSQKSRSAMSARYNIAHQTLGLWRWMRACSRSAKSGNLVTKDKPLAVTRFANVTSAAAGPPLRYCRVPLHNRVENSQNSAKYVCNVQNGESSL
ncbi:hypothetical protein HBI23_185950 [Parastagonospora nodorum]|nr:hypothetical protein HBH51_210920 [Parastagonospora nodorum]KAH4184227.1 hypothetical protein HBH42_193810 [Parastagonospora nodorum]KAH5645631.1 hypothetical protein HBI23_185950 [Parastagonospora nodorum]KAH6391101.1 hypothetical protein HBI60_170360 [Parastagonospora nodorum]KAH6526484.1 hypothetical protein HBI07_193840 [Parastagonospora nodorum]